MNSPTILQQEHLGLAKVHALCAKMNAIWRPTASGDVGIDGQIEFLEPGSVVSTGKLIAVQVKSGPSYFTHQDDHYVKYYASATHRIYWSRLPIPVILVLNDPDNDVAYYARLKPQLDGKNPILVAKASRFVPESRIDLVTGAEEDQKAMDARFDPERVLRRFRKASIVVSEDTEFNGIHFLLACYKPDSPYFELRQARLSQVMHAIALGPSIGMGSDYYDLLLRCVLMSWSYKLTESFEEDFEKMWYELQMVPDIEVPLTEVGKKLIEHLLKHAEAYIPIEEARKRGCDTSTQYATSLMLLAQVASEELDGSDELGEEPRS